MTDSVRSRYRDDPMEDSDSDIPSSSLTTARRKKPDKGSYRTVQRYRVTPSRAEEVENEYPRDNRRDFERIERIERPRSATDFRPQSSITERNFERRPSEYSPERERTSTVVYERDRERSRSRERGLPSILRDWRDPHQGVYESDRYQQETEYYDRPEPNPQPIIIRQRALEPQSILVQEAAQPPPAVLPRREREEDEYYYRRDIREQIDKSSSDLPRKERDEDTYYDRRDVRRPSVTASDTEYSDDDYVVKRRIVRRERSRSYSPHPKMHLAEGALASAGSAALLASHRAKQGMSGEHRGRNVVGGAGLGAIGAEVLTRARSRYRDPRDDWSRSRSRSRSRWRSRSRSPTRIKTAIGLAAAGLAAAAAAKYTSNRRTALEMGRGRSRTRSPPRRRWSDEYDHDFDYSAHRRARSRSRSTGTIAKAGASTAAVAAVAEHIRNKSRRRSGERSKSRIRTGAEIAGAGLAGAAVAGLYENRKAKEFTSISSLPQPKSLNFRVPGQGRGGRGSVTYDRMSRARIDNQTRPNAMKRFSDDPKHPSSVPSDIVSSLTADPAKQNEIEEKAKRNAESSADSPPGKSTIIPSRILPGRECELQGSALEIQSLATRALSEEQEVQSKEDIDVDRAVLSQLGERTIVAASLKEPESQSPIIQGSSAVNDVMLSKLEDIPACLPPTHFTRQAVTKSWPLGKEPLQAHRIRYHAHWDLPNFVASCFADLPPSKCQVENIFTITGDNENAQGTSAESYLKENWPEVSDVLLKALNDFVMQPNHDKIVVNLNEITLDLNRNANDAEQVTISVEAPYLLHISFATAFSWICAAFRRTDHDIVCRSATSVWAPMQNSEIKEEVALESDTRKIIEIRLNDLEPIESASSCWYEMFPGYALASGHPIRPRKQGVGLEIAFVDMVLTSQCLSFVTKPSGLVIHGLTSVLIPMSVLPKDNAIQWHFEDKLKQKDIKIAQLSEVLASPKFRDRAVLHDLKPESLVTRRCFLGYAAKANIVIGTKDYPTKLDRSQARTSMSTPRITSPIYLPFGSGTFISSSIFQQGMLATSSYKSLLRICAASKDQLVLVYDTGQEIGWYLPQTSVILHLAHSHLRFCDYVLYKANPPSTYDYRSTRRGPNSYESEKGCIGFSSPHPDGHAEALSAIQKSLKLKVKIRNDVESPEDEDFGQILQQIWHLLSHVSAVLGSRQIANLVTIKGVDLRDVVTLQNGIDVKEVQVDQPWALLTQVQPLVLLVRNVEPPIASEPENICKTWLSVPTGRKYMVTTGSIIRSFLERQSNGLGEHVEWEAGRDLIQTHSHGTTQPIYHTQRLRIGDKALPNTTLLSLIDKYTYCCLVFGDSKERRCFEKVLCDDEICCSTTRSKPVQVANRPHAIACRDINAALPDLFSTNVSLADNSPTASSEVTSNSLHLTDGTSDAETPSPSTPRLLSDTVSSKSGEDSFTFSTNNLSDIIPGMNSEPIWLQKTEKSHVSRNKISRLPRRSPVPLSTSKAENRTQQSSNWEVQKP
ncbi:uncharacterized protein PAC_17080 [Phialocephala subalpina]|uniref:Uncharacterized protein n=1 Tax=Phialocephala subalpina TaxID=576137 RepID=A0A1L7XQ56_9HELO|nr:uncharacterized protein PAC_17080 [Phialocephala subalpina]